MDLAVGECDDNVAEPLIVPESAILVNVVERVETERFTHFELFWSQSALAPLSTMDGSLPAASGTCEVVSDMASCGVDL